jgi:hypothetical protein
LKIRERSINVHVFYTRRFQGHLLLYSNKSQEFIGGKKKKTHCHYNELKNQIINQPPQLDKIICQNQLLTISIVSISETKHNITTPKTITLKQNTGPFQINSRKIPKLYNSINQFD